MARLQRARRVAGFCVALAIVLPGCGGPPASSGDGLASTYTGAPADYRGDGLLLVVTWADWASVWPLLRPEVEQYQAVAPAGVDFLYVNADEQPAIVRHTGAVIVPSVVFIRDGQPVATLPNVTTADELHRRAQEWL